MVIMPAIVYSENNIKNFFGGDFIDFHTVTFHALVCLYFFLVISLRLYKFSIKRDLPAMAIFLAVYVIIATVLSYTLKVNFHNLYKCNLEPVENIRLAMVEAMGWFGNAIYVTVLFILTIFFAYLAYFGLYGFVKLVGKIKNKVKAA